MLFRLPADAAARHHCHPFTTHREITSFDSLFSHLCGIPENVVWAMEASAHPVLRILEWNGFSWISSSKKFRRHGKIWLQISFQLKKVLEKIPNEKSFFHYTFQHLLCSQAKYIMLVKSDYSLVGTHLRENCHAQVIFISLRF